MVEMNQSCLYLSLSLSLIRLDNWLLKIDKGIELGVKGGRKKAAAEENFLKS